MAQSKEKTLAALRAEIRRLEGYGLAEEAQRLSFGLEPLDALLPAAGLPLPALHLVEPARKEWDDGLASGFLAALLGRVLKGAGRDGPLLWISRHADLYAPGLLSFGLAPERLLLVQARSDREVLWCLEEGLRDGAPSALVGELGAYDQVAARRLQLAAESAARPCFLLLRPFTAPRKVLPGGPASHWRVSPAPGSGGAGAVGLPGRAAWFIELLRCRGGRSGTCLLEWNDATGDFSLAAPLCDAESGALESLAS